jgi:Fur family ferric uptake transcriptional regulator
MDTDRVEALLDRLREAGQRITTAKRAMLETLVTAGDHLTADDLSELIRSSHPGVHEATVYRVLNAFEEAGVVEHVHLGHGRAVYHLADAVHHHLVCDECGRVIEVPTDLFRPMERKLKERFGFAVGAYHFAVGGLCERCQVQPAARGRRPSSISSPAV